jgi:mercuric reductase
LNELDNVDFLEGDATFRSNNELDIEGEIIKGRKFLIATGASTYIPPIEGINDIDYLTHIKALQMDKVPESMIVLGGGPLAVELSQIYARFGTKIYMFKRSPIILKKEEPELSMLLRKYLEMEGIEIYTDSIVKKIEKKGDRKIIKVNVGGVEKTFEAEDLLIATGRVPNTSNIGLEKLNLKFGKTGEIIVNDEMHAGSNIWAAGDVVGEPMLETVAAREGMIAANNALSKNKIKMDYRVVPHAIFTDPQLASVGFTDKQAIKMGYTCRCNTISMELVPKAQAIKDVRGAIKMVIDDKTEEILGVHILNSNAADIIHEAAMIIKNRLKLDDVIETLHVFPTLSESIKLVAQSFKKDIKKMSCCVE